MKRTFTILILFLAFFFARNANAQCTGNVTIPDVNFKAALLAIPGLDANSDGLIQCTEAVAFTGAINVSNKSITNLTGIESFINITTLKCDSNSLASFDVHLNTALIYLDCSYNSITSLNVSSNTALITLFCYNNSLTSLDVSHNTALNDLRCDNNLLTSLDVHLNTALRTLFCMYNYSLKSLDVSHNTVLYDLRCYYDSLTSLDVHLNTALSILDCFNNSFTSLDVHLNTALAFLRFNNNSLTSIDVHLNTALTDLLCDNNSLTSLDVAANTALNNLDCGGNSLTSLDVHLNTALTFLECSNSSLTSLDVSANTALYYLDCSQNSLTSLDVHLNTALTTLYCSQNSLTSLNVKNGNNTKLTAFSAVNNTGLSCIQVDNAAWSTTHWTNKDAGAGYSMDCSCGIPPAISSQSTATQTQCINGTFTPITITATGTNLVYQWYKNITADTTAGDTVGANSNNYTPLADTAGSRYYYCIVTGACGTPQTSAVSGAFIVNTATTNISSQSTATQMQCINGTFTPITITATGTNLAYQWYKNTTAVTTGGVTVGLNSNSYTPLANSSGTLYYYCKVTGTCGTPQTSDISGAFIVNPATAISSQSTSTQTQCINGTFTPITVTATGTNLVYQWYKNITAVITDGITVGTNSNSYTPLTDTAGTRYYYCIINGDCGTPQTSAESGAFIVNTATTNISSQSTATQTQCINGTFTPITVTATGTNLVYQWYKNTTASNSGGTSLVSANGARTYSYTPSAATSGTLYYYCIITGACGTPQTSAVSEAFIVNPATNISSQSTAAQTQCINGTFTPITITATGTNLTYQWYSNTIASNSGGASLGSANGAQTYSYTPSAAILDTLYYYCIVTGACGTPQTSAVSGAFIVGSATTNISSQSTATQTQCTFTPITVTATGTNLTYQWYSNTTAINNGGASLGSANGAQTYSYTPSATTSGTLYYYCIVSGDCGTPQTIAISGAFTFALPTISGSATVCQNSTGNVYTTESGMTGYTWNVTGGTITSGSTTDSIIVTWTTSGAKSLNVNYTNSNNCTATTATVKNVTVNPAPAMPTLTGPTTACVHSTGNIYTTNSTSWSVTGGTVNSAVKIKTGYTLSITWNTSGAESVNVTNTVNGCTATKVLNVTVNPLPLPAISGNISACINSTGNSYSTDADMTNYTWNVTGGTITSGSTTNSILVTWNTSGAQTVSVNYNNANGCRATTATVKSVTVNPYSVGGSIGGGVSVCYGTNSTLLTLTGYIGSIVKWQYSTDNWSTSNDISDTSNTYTATNLTATTQYRAVVGSGVCSTANSSTITITVNPLPVAGAITGGNAICMGSTLTLTSNATGTPTLTYVWYSSNTNTATVDINGLVTSLAAGSTNITYTVTDGSTTACSATSAIFGVTVNPLLVGGNITGGNVVCMGSALQLTSNATGTPTLTYVWNSSITGVANVDNNGLVTPLEVGSTNITYTVTDGSTTACSATSAIFGVTVNQLPSPTISGSTNLCNYTTANVYTTEAGMAGYTWNVSGGTITAGGTSPDNTATITWNTIGTDSLSVNYINTNSCTAISATIYKVTVNSLPVPTISGTTSVCINSTGNVYSTESGMTGYTWSIDGGIITAGSTTNAATVTWNTSGAKSISVNYTNVNSCAAASAIVYNVTVNAASNGGNISGGANVCNGTNSTLLTLSGQTGSVIKWQYTDDMGYHWYDINNTGTTNTATNLNTTTSFRAVVKSGVCDATPGGYANVTVQSLVTAGTIATAQTICNNTTPVALTSATAGTGSNIISYEWQTNASGSYVTVSSEIAAGYQPPTLTATTAYQRRTVSTNGSNVCYSDFTSPITITVQSTPIAGAIATAQTICYNTAPSGLTSATYGDGDGTITYEWQTNASGSYVTIASETSANYQPPTLTTTTAYQRRTVSTIGSNVCNSDYTFPITMTVYNAFAEGSIATTGESICYNTNPTTEIGNTTVASGGDNSITYEWRSSADSYATAISGATASTYTPAGPLTTTTSYQRYANDNTCNTTPIVSTGTWTITVNTLPVPTISGPTGICNNTTGNVYTTESGNTSYVWTVPGGTITEGSGTNAITVTWNTEGAQTVSVNYSNSNGCTAATATVYGVTLKSAPNPVITGSPNNFYSVPKLATYQYSTPLVVGDLYSWSSPKIEGYCSESARNCVNVHFLDPCCVYGEWKISVTETNPVTGCSTIATKLIYITP